MIGFVDSSGRAIISLPIVTESPEPVLVEVWIDTGFTGELVFPKTMIDQFALEQSGSIDAVLADGAQLELDTYSCKIH